MSDVDVEVTLTTVNCGVCGGTYAINERYRARAREHGTTWTCPYCKCSWGYIEGENAKLKKQVEQEQRAKASLEGRLRRTEESRDYQERRGNAYKGHLTRTKNRVAKGVCPCCNRTFVNLGRHMKAKHPDYVADPSAEPAP